MGCTCRGEMLEAPAIATLVVIPLAANLCIPTHPPPNFEPMPTGKF